MWLFSIFLKKMPKCKYKEKKNTNLNVIFKRNMSERNNIFRISSIESADGF